MRVVYRLKGADDLSISDLDALDRLAAAGCLVRYSNRLHAKVVIVDDTDAVVSSSNLTATAGYSTKSGPWQNEELGVHLNAEPVSIGPRRRGSSRSGATPTSCRSVLSGSPWTRRRRRRFGWCASGRRWWASFVAVGTPARTIGQVTSVSSYNPTVPAEIGDTNVSLGLRGGGGGQRSFVPDVQTLFSHPSKTHAFLMAQTFVKSEATYQHRRRRGPAKRRARRPLLPVGHRRRSGRDRHRSRPGPAGRADLRTDGPADRDRTPAGQPIGPGHPRP